MEHIIGEQLDLDERCRACDVASCEGQKTRIVERVITTLLNCVFFLNH